MARRPDRIEDTACELQVGSLSQEPVGCQRADKDEPIVLDAVESHCDSAIAPDDRQFKAKFGGGLGSGARASATACAAVSSDGIAFVSGGPGDRSDFIAAKFDRAPHRRRLQGLERRCAHLEGELPRDRRAARLLPACSEDAVAARNDLYLDGVGRREWRFPDLERQLRGGQQPQADLEAWTGDTHLQRDRRTIHRHFRVPSHELAEAWPSRERPAKV